MTFDRKWWPLTESGDFLTGSDDIYRKRAQVYIGVMVWLGVGLGLGLGLGLIRVRVTLGLGLDIILFTVKHTHTLNMYDQCLLPKTVVTLKVKCHGH